MYQSTKNLFWLVVSLAIFVLDQVSKYIIIHSISYGEPLAVLPFLSLTLTHNPGAAFNLLSHASGWQRWLFIAIALIVSGFVIAWLYRLKPGEHWIALSLSLILGGALGNVWDRIIHGYVIDFIQVYYKQWAFPDFNLADSAITVGVIILVISSLIKSKKD